MNDTRKGRTKAPDDVDLVEQQWARELPGADLSGLSVSLRLTRIGKLMDLSFSAFCKDRFNLQNQDMRVLFALHRSGTPYALRPTDLFRALLVTSGAITKQVDRLVAVEMVERTPDPDHGGGWLIRLTEKGLYTAEAAMRYLIHDASVSNAISELLRSFDTRDRELVENFVVDLLHTIENVAQDKAPRK